MKRIGYIIYCLIFLLTGCSFAETSTPIKVGKQTTKNIEKTNFAEKQLFFISMKKFQTSNTTTKMNVKKLAISQLSLEVERKINIDAPLINQLPELPRGCEVTSLAMLLKYVGLEVDKMALARQIKKDPTPYHNEDGQIFFGNPNKGFVGDMYTYKKPGFGVFHAPIYQLAKRYLPNAVDLTGGGWQTVEDYLKRGHPVWVITTSWFTSVPLDQWQTWQTPEGPVRITMHEHSVLITGFDEEYVYFNDPLVGIKNRKVKKDNFIAGWKQFGMQAISY